MKRVLIIATGGTIASTPDEHGLKPNLNVSDLIRLSGIKDKECLIDGVMVMNIDSTNMTPERWFEIAKVVEENYFDYDGFVITHGTDTMAYTSSALSYILKDLNKPVIMTGSQYPITEEYTDAILNLTDAIRFAMETLKGIFLVFDGELIVGTRAVKVKTKSYDAFESVNYPSVASIKHHKISYTPHIAEQFMQNEEHSKLELFNDFNDRILVLKLFPGMYADIFDYVKLKYSGVIIESFGIGGIPSDSRNMSAKIKELVDEGVIVVLTTQCLEEGVDFGIYEVGSLIPADKVIFAGDINTEALVSKTIIGMGNYSNFIQLKEFIETPLSNKIL